MPQDLHHGGEHLTSYQWHSCTEKRLLDWLNMCSCWLHNKHLICGWLTHVIGIVLCCWKLCKSTKIVDLYYVSSDTRMIVKDSYVGNACNELLPRIVLQELPNSTRIAARASCSEVLQIQIATYFQALPI